MFIFIFPLILGYYTNAECYITEVLQQSYSYHTFIRMYLRTCNWYKHMHLYYCQWD